MKDDGACLFRAVGMCHALKFKKHGKICVSIRGM